MSEDPAEVASRLWKLLDPMGEAIISESLNLGRVQIGEKYEPDRKDYVGHLAAKEGDAVGWVVLSRPTACAIAGLLLERPPASIKHNVEDGSLVGDDADAIAEFANQFISPINDLIRELGVEPVHFVLDEGASDGSVTADPSGMLVLTSTIDPGHLGPGTLTIIVPPGPLGAAPTSAPTPGSPSGGRETGAEEARAQEGRSGSAQPDAEDASDASGGLSLTPEELAAIREATQQMGKGARILFVAPLERERASWKLRLDTCELDYAFAMTLVGIPQELRSGEFSVVVVDADACPSGGLSALAKIRSAGVPSLVVAVLVSSPTKNHLIGCLAAGAQLYLRKPIEPQALADALANAAAAA